MTHKLTVEQSCVLNSIKAALGALPQGSVRELAIVQAHRAPVRETSLYALAREGYILRQDNSNVSLTPKGQRHLGIA